MTTIEKGTEKMYIKTVVLPRGRRPNGEIWVHDTTIHLRHEKYGGGITVEDTRNQPPRDYYGDEAEVWLRRAGLDKNLNPVNNNE